MYVYEFQRKAREYLLGQKLSLKSITQKYNKELLAQQQSPKKQTTSIQYTKTEKTEQTISDQELTATKKNQKAFLIRKSPDYSQIALEKRKHYSIYTKQENLQRQMSIQEYIYPKPMKIIKQKLIMQTPAFKNYVAKKILKTDENEKNNSNHQGQFIKYFNPVNENNQTIRPPPIEHQHKLSGWSINTNESKY